MARLSVARVNRPLYQQLLESRRLLSIGSSTDALALLEQINVGARMDVRTVF
jgi:hypothetical protein